jgi:hypothetical protein
MKSILFTPGNVKAILDGLKWQTRREIKPQPKGEFCRDDLFISGLSLWDSEDVRKAKYKVGETIYVKEAYYDYGKWEKNGLTKTGKQKYRFIDFKLYYGKEYLYDSDEFTDIETKKDGKFHWYKRNALFMPEKAARLFIEITNIRVEKLGDISEQDAIAEGIQKHEGGYKTNYRQPDAKSYLDGYEWTAQESYQTLWESINGPGSWDLNPWVFAYDFKRVGKPQ